MRRKNRMVMMMTRQNFYTTGGWVLLIWKRLRFEYDFVVFPGFLVKICLIAGFSSCHIVRQDLKQ